MIQDVRHLSLRENMCSQCPFSRKGVNLTPGYLAHIIDYLTEGMNHVCHTNDTKVCYGGRELQLKIFTAQGKIKEPTNESLFEAMRELGIEPTIK